LAHSTDEEQWAPTGSRPLLVVVGMPVVEVAVGCKKIVSKTVDFEDLTLV